VMEDYTPIDEDFPGRLLHQAALWDNAELLEDLLRGEHAQYINSKDSWGRTPMHAAAITENSRCLDVLLTAGADPNVTCGPRGHHRTPLHVCAEHGHAGNVETLLNFDADLMIRDDDGLKPIDIAEKSSHDSCIHLLKAAAEKYELAKQATHASLRAACIQGDTVAARNIIQGLSTDLECVVNMTPNGANTLLFVACESGHKDIVRLLLDHGADCRIHPVTKYCPLYIACYHGKLEIVELLLRHFPKQVQQLTVERWLPIHAATINGHHLVIDVLLKFEYPQHVYQRYKDPSGEFEYELPFDINAQDVTGQHALYIASMLGNVKCVELLLDKKDDKMIYPVNLDLYCNNGSETALHVAVRGKHTEVVNALLQAGANLELPVKIPYDQNDPDGSYSSVLTIACQNRDVKIADLLLKHGAVDNECKALKIAAQNRDEALTAKLLSIKAHPDSEYKINKKAMTECTQSSHFSALSSFGHVTYSTLFPKTPTMINWHNQQCHLSQIRLQWLIDAVLHVNKKLSSKNNDLVLYAITRIDISLNSITSVPSTMFYLQSLRYLNMAQNKIDTLTADSKNPKDKLCPVLEEMYLQDNRLEQLPEFIMNLPALEIMDVSNNKLQCLPQNLWRAPKLKELNASFNLLRDLPSQASQNVLRKPQRGEEAQQNGTNFRGLAAVPRIESMEFDSFTKIANAQVIEMERPHVWTSSVQVSERMTDDTENGNKSVLASLNLAHNLFNSIPVALPCLAVSLVRLNMAYNSLRSMSHITSYPASLKQLDLSNNQITRWPSLPQVDSSDSMEQANTACYCPAVNAQSPSIVPGNRQTPTSIRDIVLQSVCVHRRHLRLENLRTLILANNLLNRIQLTSCDDDPKIGHPGSKLYLLFPNVSMLDISNNQLREIPHNIYELNNLSVLNISGNNEIVELPPQMGLLGRLWNLNTQGCRLQEPLKSMIESKKYKTMDVIGYLKSILEDAKAYARMKLMIVGIQGIGKTSLLEQLRQEGEVPNKKKASEHWAKRMGNKNINAKTAKVRGQSSHGPVYFRTWDFGGQREYYATHQYFLSKRSLYLVVWRITDGFKGVSEIFQWLVNIQSRAPNSPVIIVGTHYDVSYEHSEGLQQYIRDKFINVVDAEKCGLPKVMETIEVSCKTRHNIKMLCNLIYDVVFSLRSPGSKELLLEQKVPASYLALEDVVIQLAHDRKLSGLDPVLKADQYYAAVNNELQKLHRSFRDPAELHQATLFLHENGIILHYDDATLKDLYFLDPQWLCDMLAHVVTIREINPFARSGIMKLDDIQHVFKSSTISSIDTQGYIVSLLNKFEVALTWDCRTLLIPSLLPTEEDILRNNQIIKVPVKTRVSPGPNSTQSAILAYKASQSKWDRDPLQYACKAYCMARQELNILLTLRHTNIVPLIGIVVSPLALVLDLAPQGALDAVLKNYRRSGAKLDPYTLQAIILQVAKAVEYLHQQHVIYRDLKSENVLVWQMPLPFQENPEPAHVKVADYGISRLTLPTGAKGFGGTEGFMAPEIIRYNGEEEYTEKVDSFSFGMFIYELITLRQPFEGHEAVKECILEGGRPPLMYRETFHPCYALDLMVICWAQNPKDRPTASQIVSIASAPEFTHLIDVTLLTERTQVTAVTMTNHCGNGGSNDATESLNSDEIWFGHNNGEVDMLLGTQKGWLRHVRIETPVIPYAMCGVDGYIWIGDNAGQIHVYLCGNFGCVASYNLEADHSRESKVVGLIHLEQLKQFAVALHSGRIFLLSNTFMQMKKTEVTGGSNGTEMTRHNADVKTYSLAAVCRKRRVLELWAGQSYGRISIYTLKDGNLADTTQLSHCSANDAAMKNLFATYLIGVTTESFVFSYTYPGCVVYQWDVDSRQIINKLDMSKLVPCSESLKSIAIEENLSSEKCQVTALEASCGQLYIGTTWGCIVVAECSTLRPVTVFRPFEGKVCQIVSLKSTDKRKTVLATVGQGYRSLIARYTDFPLKSLENEELRHGMYTLLWRSENWSAA
ncbi:Leucine-rich repeat serine/threonine-protein kinase 1, partial [Trachymyrmex cornetzi]